MLLEIDAMITSPNRIRKHLYKLIKSCILISAKQLFVYSMLTYIVLDYHLRVNGGDLKEDKSH